MDRVITSDAYHGAMNPRLRIIAATTLLAIASSLLSVGIAAAAREFPAGDERYHTYAELTDRLHAIAADHPDIVQLGSIGKSYQGRELWLLKISDHVATDEPEPEVLVTALTHAREHMTVEQALALIGWLVDGYGTNPRTTAIVDSTELWVIPELNPDGGEWDIRGGRYHHWRKNRQPTPGTRAIGTDLNRNYGYRFDCCGGSSDPVTERNRKALLWFLEQAGCRTAAAGQEPSCSATTTSARIPARVHDERPARASGVADVAD